MGGRLYLLITFVGYVLILLGLLPEQTPYDKVKIFTDEWWDILHTALKTATELNIEMDQMVFALENLSDKQSSAKPSSC